MGSLLHFTMIVLMTISFLEYKIHANFTQYIPDGNLFDCLLGWTFGEAPADASIEAYLIVTNDQKTGGPYENLEEIHFSKDLVSMKSNHLNHKLPFKFFINGYNLNGPVTDTWMYKVAQALVNHHRFNAIPLNEYNYVILYWQIPGLSTNDLLDSIVFYHRTMDKYKQVVAKAAAIVDRLIRDGEKKLIASRDHSQLIEYFNKFQFYGHSLGGQIVFHMAQTLQKRRPDIKFGKIIGLDPSLLCFKPGEYGINGVSGRKFAGDVVVVHSSSGIIGVPDSPGTTEIVLNGGTFQPSCSLTEISCHHSRSWGVLNYFDDTCQMVAYACQNRAQFKDGSCPHSKLLETTGNDQFKLVNLAEQHFSKPFNTSQIFSTLQEGEGIMEELNPALIKLTSNYLNRTTQDQSGSPIKKFYYVNTAPAGNNDRMSHCLQHYQARLIILNQNSRLDDDCKITKFRQDQSNQLRITLGYIVPTEEFEMKNEGEATQQSFVELIPGKLFTSLINYSGSPNLYTSGLIERVDVKAWADCLSNKKIDGNFTFILDISFMSNISPEIRRSFSSVLCGKWTPGSSKSQLLLNLCNRTKLLNADEYLDSYLVVGNQQRREPWYIQLVNSLSHTIINWDPLRSRELGGSESMGQSS